MIRVFMTTNCDAFIFRSPFHYFPITFAAFQSKFVQQPQYFEIDEINFYEYLATNFSMVSPVFTTKKMALTI